MSLSNGNNGMGPADIAAVVNGGFGGGWGWGGPLGMMGMMGGWGFGGLGGWGGGGIMDILVLFLLFGLLGNGGFGGFGGNRCGANTTCATPADVYNAVDQQTLISKLDQQTYGIADSTFALNNTMTTGFANAELSRCNMQAAFMQQLNNMAMADQKCCCETREAIQANTTQGIMNTGAIQRQIADCCCDLEKMNMQNRFDAQNNTCSTLQAIDKLGDRIIGHLNDRETQALRDENQALRLRASQADQNAVLRAAIDASTAEIIRRTGNECPVPAYVVPNPNCCYGNPLGVGYNNSGYGWNGGCGCGNCA